MLLSLPVTLEAHCVTMRLLAATADTKLLVARVLAEKYWRRGCSPDGYADTEAAGAGEELAHCPPCSPRIGKSSAAKVSRLSD